MCCAVSRSRSGSDPGLPFSRAANGIRVALKVTPRAARDAVGPVQIEADGTGVLKVSVTSVPEKGRANEAVTKLLAKAWGVPRSRITVAAGAAGRRKTLLVQGEPNAVMAAIETWLEKTYGRSPAD